jgi:hypothetical protein
VTHRCSSSASLGLTDYSQVDILGMRYKSVNFGRKGKGAIQISEPK